jgi:FkbM family methyltransferase
MQKNHQVGKLSSRNGALHEEHGSRGREDDDKAAKASFLQENADANAEALRHKLIAKCSESANRSGIPQILADLPRPILNLAWTTFQSEGAIVGAIENSVLVDVTYAGVQMSLRMNKFDDAVKRTGEESTWFSYDLDSLNDALDENQQLLNMMDIGGNYGVITIAAMKKHENLRIITVEPSPVTYFFMKWNFYINGIPEIAYESMVPEDQHVPGVLTLNKGISDQKNQELHFCNFLDSSMNSKVCDCKRGDKGCYIVGSIAFDDLFYMFGSETINMVKMDCEGCEFKGLPALANNNGDRVRRFAGELHLPDENLESLACRWDNGRLVSKCQRSAKNADDIECNVELNCPN